MDADGQDQPEAIPDLLAALEGGLDLATGRRVERNDRFIKRHTSRLYNRVTSAVTGVEGQDFNSGLKAMRRDVMTPLVLYGELHRYIPVLANWSGFRVGEVPVEHKPRLHGASKFGRARFWRGFLDLLTVKFITTYTGPPVPPLRRSRDLLRGGRGRPDHVDADREDRRRGRRDQTGAAGRDPARWSSASS